MEWLKGSAASLFLASCTKVSGVGETRQICLGKDYLQLYGFPSIGISYIVNQDWLL